MNVLLTSVGRRSYLVDYFREALDGRGKVIGANTYAEVAGMYAADEAVVVPPSHDKTYVGVIEKLCRDHKVGLLCSCHDLDVFFLARGRDRLFKAGAIPVLPEHKWATLSLDKYECGLRLQECGLAVPWTSGSLDETKTALAEGRVRFPLIVKARHGFGSLGLHRCHTDDELDAWHRQASKEVLASPLQWFGAAAEELVLIQEVIEGPEYRLQVVNDLQGCYATHFACEVHTMRAGESDTVTTIDPELFGDLPLRLSAMTRHPGIWGIDLMVDKGVPKIIDMNPRFAGEYPFHHIAGANIPAALLAWARGDSPKAEWLRPRVGIKGYKDLYPRKAPELGVASPLSVANPRGAEVTPLAINAPIYVGCPNVGNRSRFLRRVNALLDRRRLTNNGPMVQNFEQSIASRLDVKHCIAMSNATTALEIASRVLELKGEVIMPAYTFVATAHAFQWSGITPVFADINPKTHHIDRAAIEKLITPGTSAIVGVHLWGRACDIEGVEAIARKYKLRVIYDAAHAFGCSYNGRMIGGFGACEVFSFHATKFLNSFEGGAVTTNDDLLAEKLRLMRNFGFVDFDRVISLGTNGKMTEICAAMGLTSLEACDEIIAINRRNYAEYLRQLSNLPGISLLRYNDRELNNYHYIVAEVDRAAAGLTRDELIRVLHAKNVLARKYFWPGCHQMEPYRSLPGNSVPLLPVTERVAERVIVLPTGQTVDENTIERICDVIRSAMHRRSSESLALAD